MDYKVFQNKNQDFLAQLYKREIFYTHVVLAEVDEEKFDSACKKIIKMMNKIDKEIFLNSRLITDYERLFYQNCQTKEGILSIAKTIKERCNNQQW